MDPLPAPHPSRVFRVDGNCEFSWFFSCKGILRRIERIENIIVVSKHGYFLSAILLRIPWASRLPGGEGVPFLSIVFYLSTALRNEVAGADRPVVGGIVQLAPTRQQRTCTSTGAHAH